MATEQAEARCSARQELCMWVGPASGRSAHEMSCHNVALRSELRALLDRIAALEHEMRTVNPSSRVLATPLTITMRDGRLMTVTTAPAPSPPTPQPPTQPVSKYAPIEESVTSEEVNLRHPAAAPPPPPTPPAHVHRSVPNVGEASHHSSAATQSNSAHAPNVADLSRAVAALKPACFESLQQSEPASVGAPMVNAADLSRAFAALKPVEEESSVVGDAPVRGGSAHNSELDQVVSSHRSQHENVAAEDPAVQAERMRKLRERQENEEAEFRRRREEAERQKKATLDAMKASDDERRQRLLASAPAVAPSHNTAPHYTGTQPASNFAVPTQPAQTGSKCGGCGQVIPAVGSFMKANGKKWHADCLRCAMCRSTLENGFRPKGQKLYCDKCWNKAT